MITRSQSRKRQNSDNRNQKKGKMRKREVTPRRSSILNSSKSTHQKSKGNDSSIIFAETHKNLVIPGDGAFFEVNEDLKAESSFRGQKPLNRGNMAGKGDNQSIWQPGKAKASKGGRGQSKKPFSYSRRSKTQIKLEYERSALEIDKSSKASKFKFKTIVEKNDSFCNVRPNFLLFLLKNI